MPRKRGVARLRARLVQGWSLPALRPPLDGGGCCEQEAKKPGRSNALGNEETALFDIVKIEGRERRIGNVALEPIASAATHSVPAEGALQRVIAANLPARASESCRHVAKCLDAPGAWRHGWLIGMWLPWSEAVQEDGLEDAHGLCS